MFCWMEWMLFRSHCCEWTLCYILSTGVSNLLSWWVSSAYCAYNSMYDSMTWSKFDELLVSHPALTQHSNIYQLQEEETSLTVIFVLIRAAWYIFLRRRAYQLTGPSRSVTTLIFILSAVIRFAFSSVRCSISLSSHNQNALPDHFKANTLSDYFYESLSSILI